jgi:hypothetical protein
MKPFFFMLLVSFSAIGCRETVPEDRLPPVTQTGANTFGCKINGKVYTPKSSKNDLSDIMYPVYTGVMFDCDNNTLNTLIHIEKTELTTISLYINDTVLLSEKEYTLNGQGLDNLNGRVTIQYLTYDTTNLWKTYTAIPNSGSITITKNTDNIISGIFSGKLMRGNDQNDIIEVTEGRFDFNKNTINSYKFP